ncbi:hypothetical protein [Phascolarctobacterium sp.]
MLINFLKKYKYRIIAMILFPFVCLTLLDLLWGDAMEQGKKDLQAHIPAVMVYNSNVPLNEVLKADARTPDFITAMHLFPLTTDTEGNIIKKYYTDNLLKLGWDEISYKPIIKYSNDVHYGDRFVFEKDEYRIVLFIVPPLDKTEEKGLLNEKPRYTIHFGKKNVIDD